MPGLSQRDQAAGLEGEEYKGVVLIREYSIADVSLMHNETIMELMQEWEKYYGSN